MTAITVATINHDAIKVLLKKKFLTTMIAAVGRLKVCQFLKIIVSGSSKTNQNRYSLRFRKEKRFIICHCSAIVFALFVFVKSKYELIIKNKGTAMRSHGYKVLPIN